MYIACGRYKVPPAGVHLSASVVHPFGDPLTGTMSTLAAHKARAFIFVACFVCQGYVVIQTERVARSSIAGTSNCEFGNLR